MRERARRAACGSTTNGRQTADGVADGRTRAINARTDDGGGRADGTDGWTVGGRDPLPHLVPLSCGGGGGRGALLRPLGEMDAGSLDFRYTIK